MRLPRGKHARIDDRKIRLYLLSETHPVGRHKLRFLEKAGYCSDRPDEVRTALLSVARTGTVADTVVSGHGISYIVDGTIVSPSGIRLALRTVWIASAPGGRPRFVTAYPG